MKEVNSQVQQKDIEHLQDSIQRLERAIEKLYTKIEILESDYVKREEIDKDNRVLKAEITRIETESEKRHNTQENEIKDIRKVISWIVKSLLGAGITIASAVVITVLTTNIQ